MTMWIIASTLILLPVVFLLWLNKQQHGHRYDTVRQELWRVVQHARMDTEHWLGRLPATLPSHTMLQEVLKRLAGVESRLRQRTFSVRREQSQILRAQALHLAAVKLAHTREVSGNFETLIAQELVNQAEQLVEAVKAHSAALPSIKLAALSTEISVAKRAFLHGDNASACWHAEQAMRLAREIGNQIAQAHTQAIEKALRHTRG